MSKPGIPRDVFRDILNAAATAFLARCQQNGVPESEIPERLNRALYEASAPADGIPRSAFEQSMRRAVRALCIRQAVIASPNDPAFAEIWAQYTVDLDESLEAAGVGLEPRPESNKPADAPLH